MKNHIFISLGLYRLSSEALWIFQDATEEQLEALEDLLAHVSISPDGKSYQERIDFAMDIIDAGMDGTLITVSPFVKYPPGSNYASQYPELTNYLKNEFPQLINDDLIVNALIQYGSLSEQQIKDGLEWGDDSSTTIEILDSNLMPFGSYGCYRVCGFGDYTVVISSALANALQNNSTISEDALNFFVGLIIMHEITHMGDFLYNGDMYVGKAMILNLLLQEQPCSLLMMQKRSTKDIY